MVSLDVVLFSAGNVHERSTTLKPILPTHFRIVNYTSRDGILKFLQ